MSVERAAATFSNGVLYMKLAAWTAFALAGPACFFAMRNYLGMAVTGGIGVLLGLALPAEDTRRRLVLALRVALVLQGVGFGAYGGYMLARPPDPWVFAAGHTRSSLALASSGKAYALEFSGTNAGFFVREEAGTWTRSDFPGFMSLELAVGPRDEVIYAIEDRAPLLWTLDSHSATERWEKRQGFGSQSSLAASDRAMFLLAQGELLRLDGADAPPRRVQGVGAVSVLCAHGSYVLALQPKTDQVGKAWLSEDGGVSFAEVHGASLPASLCGIADDGTLWVVAEGTFKGALSITSASATGHPRFESKTVPAPRIEAIAVNPKNGREAWVGAWGAGVYRSADGGTTWTLMGLEGYEVSALVVDFDRKRAYAGTGSGAFELRF